MANLSIYNILHVWEKASIVEGYDKNIWRKDFAGAWIRKDSYGKHTKYGWEIDHLHPISKGGNNELENLVPLHWQNNQIKAADYPIFKTMLSSDGNRNIEMIRKWQLQ